MNKEIEPCVCGNEWAYFDSNTIECPMCGRKTEGDSPQEAIEKWNRREQNDKQRDSSRVQ